MDNNSNEVENKPVREKRMRFIYILFKEVYYQGYVDRSAKEGTPYEVTYSENEKIKKILNKILPGYFSFVDKYLFTFTGEKEEYTVEAGNIEEAKDILALLLSEKIEVINKKIEPMSIKISLK